MSVIQNPRIAVSEMAADILLDARLTIDRDPSLDFEEVLTQQLRRLVVRYGSQYAEQVEVAINRRLARSAGVI